MANAAAEGAVLVAGSINTDLVARVRSVPEAGETVTGRDFAIFGGGKGANQAVAAARSGARTVILGAVGRDDFGRQRIAALRAEGIDASHVGQSAEAASGVAVILVDDAGQNRIAYVPGATMTVSADTAVAALREVRPRVVLSTLELPTETLQALFDAARQVGAMVILNAAPEPGTGRGLVPMADLLVVNQTEASELLGRRIEGNGWHDAVGELTAFGPTSVVVTLGGEGVLVSHDGRVEHVPAARVEAIDTTGAGDAFCGAMAARLAHGADLGAAVRAGAAAGAIAVTRAGAQPSMPTREEIERVLAGRGISE